MSAQSAHGPLPALLRAAHGGPTVAVTLLATALAVAVDHTAGGVLLVAGAVFTGQLSIGWSNDLVDRSRDVRVGRRDKPLVTGELSVDLVRTTCGLAVLATVVLSLLCGLGPGLLHLACVVGAGWAYNLGLKRTVLSWLPYAVAFGALPAFVTMSAPAGDAPPWWLPASGALLGVGAHILNVLPDLRDDAATGVRGFPHRLGEDAARVVAVVVLWAASLVVVLASGTARDTAAAVMTLLVVAVLGVMALRGRGRVPFQAAIAIAFVDVVLLVVAA